MISLGMATATMRPTMKNVCLMAVTVVDLMSMVMVTMMTIMTLKLTYPYAQNAYVMVCIKSNFFTLKEPEIGGLYFSLREFN